MVCLEIQFRNNVVPLPFCHNHPLVPLLAHLTLQHKGFTKRSAAKIEENKNRPQLTSRKSLFSYVQWLHQRCIRGNCTFSKYFTPSRVKTDTAATATTSETPPQYIGEQTKLNSCSTDSGFRYFHAQSPLFLPRNYFPSLFSSRRFLLRCSAHSAALVNFLLIISSPNWNEFFSTVSHSLATWHFLRLI